MVEGPFRVVQVGLGPIGLQLTRYLVERPGLRIVGAVDADPLKQGKDVGELAGLDGLGVLTQATVAQACSACGGDVALVCTVSRARQMVEQIRAIAAQKLNVLTTCEELTHPWKTQPAVAREIDEICKRHGVTCLATGVNPGFLMDYLPGVLSGLCRQVDFIRVERIQDASIRRLPFMKKIGAGMSLETFERVKDEMGHVGLKESTYMIAEALGWELDEVTETLEPVIADREYAIGELRISRSQLAGSRQRAIGYANGRALIEHLFVAAVGEERPRDRIEINGSPSFTSEIDGGVNGDIATAAIMINCIPRVLQSEPGLKTMLDIPAPTFLRVSSLAKR